MAFMQASHIDAEAPGRGVNAYPNVIIMCPNFSIDREAGGGGEGEVEGSVQRSYRP